jgi:uncharacterized protein (DUF1501 family)
MGEGETTSSTSLSRGNIMFQFESSKGVDFGDGLTRRDFLRVGALSAGAVGISLAELNVLQASDARADGINCILLFLVGGPSHLDTLDLKPAAPSTVHGPFRPIKTNVAGVDICEHFPLMARKADRFALIRSVHHDEAPIHETGHQLMQTGYVFRGGREYPHYGSVVSHLRGPKANGAPPFVVLPGPIDNTGVSVSHGQTAGYLGMKHEPVFLFGDSDPARLPRRTALIDAVDSAHRAFDAAEIDRACEHAADQLFAPKAKQAFDVAAERDNVRLRYGRNTFGQSCLLARRLVERGTRLVTVNMFDTVFDAITWDCHADGGSLPTTLNDYRDTLCPMFDHAYTALLDDLKDRGLLDTTLVLAMGEFGRTPLLNPRGGRDHWPGCWSVLFAGAGVKGGQVIGASDRTGSEPKDRPVTPAEVAASVYKGLGIDLGTRLPGPENRSVPIVGAGPIAELFRG